MTPTERSAIYSEIVKLEATVKKLKAMIYTHDKSEGVAHNTRHKTFGEVVVSTVCSFYNVSLSELHSADRHNRTAYPRRVAAYLYYTMSEPPKPSCEQIGAILTRDQSTARWAISRVASEIKTYERFKKEIDQLRQIIQQEIKNNELNLV